MGTLLNLFLLSLILQKIIISKFDLTKIPHGNPVVKKLKILISLYLPCIFIMFKSYSRINFYIIMIPGMELSLELRRATLKNSTERLIEIGKEVP